MRAHIPVENEMFSRRFWFVLNEYKKKYTTIHCAYLHFFYMRRFVKRQPTKKKPDLISDIHLNA